MSWTLCTSGSAVIKAGVHANSDIKISGSFLAQWSNEAEGRIDTETRRNWTSNYSSLSTPVKNILAEVCSSMIAKQIVSYDITGYTRTEAATILNVQDDIVTKDMAILRDFKSNTLQTP